MHISHSSDNPRQSWLLQAVHYFRGMGFFAEHQNLSDSELAEHLDALNQENQEDPKQSLDEYAAEIVIQVEADAQREAAGEKEAWDFDMPPAMADVVLVSFDKSRIWWEDGETEIWPGGEIYLKAIKGWSRISRGAFVPREIEEIWQGEEGPMHIELTLNGMRHQLEPQQHFGWLDFGLLSQINSLIADTSFQFHEVEKEFDQTTCLIVLTQEEKQRLEQERQWILHEPTGFT